MNRALIYISLISIQIFTIVSLNAQSSNLELFHGGVVGLDVRFGGNGLNSFTGTFESAGDGIAQITPGGKTVRWNPAGLAFIEKGLVYSSFQPPLSVPVNRVFNVQRYTNDQIELGIQDFVQDRASFDFEGVEVSPQVKYLGRQGNVSGILTNKYFVIGLAIHNKTSLGLDFSIDGGRFSAVSEASGGGTTIRLLGRVNGALSSEIGLRGLSFAIGKRVGNNLGVGLGYDRYASTMTVAGVMAPEAQVSSGAQEFAFNSPTSTHYDSLRAFLRGNLNGVGARWRLGVSYRLWQKLSLDAAYFGGASISMPEELNLRYDKVAAIDLKAEADEQFLDANRLIQDKFTGTLQRNVLLSDIAFTFPRHFAFSASTKWKTGRASLTYGFYGKAASLSYRYIVFGDSAQVNSEGMRQLGLKPRRVIFTNLGADWLQVKLGAVQTRPFIHSINETEKLTQTTLWFPIFAVSGGVNRVYWQRLRLDYALTFGITSFAQLGVTVGL